jgi:glycosyltransferase involved in cell wall biosynthesis
LKFILISPKNRTIYNFRGELIKEIRSKGYEIIVTGPNLDNIDEVKGLGVRFELIPLNKTGLNIFADIKYFIRLTKLFRKEKPDITFGYTIKPVIYGGIAARLAGVRNIYSMVTGAGYVYTAKTLKAKIIKLFSSILYQIGFRCSKKVIFQNKDDMEEFIENNLINRDKCELVNGSGVNMDKFSPTDFPETITFFMLSRILHSKGIREYLEAAKKVKENNPDVRFILLGAVENIQDSLKKQELDTYIKNGIIDYFGETNDVASFYKQCSVYVLPSYREGTPRTVLEAMAMGRPIITSDAPGCRETVVEGENGFLVPVKNSDLLAEKMEWFIHHQDKIHDMGQASHEICREKFDVNKVNEEMLKHMSIK